MNATGTQEPLLTVAQRAAVLAAYRAGSSSYELAARFGVAPKTIARCIPEAERRPSGFSRKGAPTSVIVELRQKGFTWEEIGPAVGISWNAAARRYARWLKRGE